MPELSYVAIDFETANSRRTSPRSIGLTKVIQGQVTESYYSLINPEEYFDPYNTQIHGINEHDVIQAPTMDELYPKLLPFIDGLPLVAHNASFDMSVLRFTFDKYRLPYPEVNYFCSYILAKKLLTLPSYRLDRVASYYRIAFHHHQASDDALVCAEIVRKMMQEFHIQTLEQMQQQINYKLGRLHKHSYAPFSSVRTRRVPSFRPSDITSKKNFFDKQHPLFHQTVVFTGLLQSMSREEACQKVADRGGINGNSVTKKTTLLVVGEPDRRTMTHSKSSKALKAERLAASGQSITIIDENHFLAMLKIISENHN
ncbi:exonuclease domain-containing protein [Sporolactobacillus shoreicorticis]|uniref:Exonuclease domain-containing protein n=1 Tax=Sporolactobacillus shoreicorticis TaxID=1923877 RepID=A0ABW5S748_9BACL|nr:exonuclease domain-containing protein [Sporolactobacillus shoreicorticis]MCO7125651.1 exonuclease domain-containing protein [Sporolactobacillus shoreicorticis]